MISTFIIYTVVKEIVYSSYYFEFLGLSMLLLVQIEIVPRVKEVTEH